MAKKRKSGVRKPVVEEEVSNDSVPDKSDDQNEEAEEYLVESVVDKRVVGGVVQYLIKWKAYNTADNTWEPANNIKDTCGDAIKNYEEKHGKKSKVIDDHESEKEEERPTPKRKGRQPTSKATVDSDDDEEDRRPKKKGRKEKEAPESDVEMDSPMTKKVKKSVSKAIVDAAALKENDELLRSPDVTVESIAKIGRSTTEKFLIALVKLDCKKSPVAVSWNVLKEYHPRVVIEHCQSMIKFRD